MKIQVQICRVGQSTNLGLPSVNSKLFYAPGNGDCPGNAMRGQFLLVLGRYKLAAARQ